MILSEMERDGRWDGAMERWFLWEGSATRNGFKLNCEEERGRGEWAGVEYLDMASRMGRKPPG